MVASEKQQQRNGTMSQDHMMTINIPDAGRGWINRRENDDERPIWYDSCRQFKRRALNNKKEYSSSSMNFLISAFLAGPEAALRPERKQHDKEEDVQSTPSLSMLGSRKQLTNNPAIAYFMNPKLWKKADNIGGGGMMIKERCCDLSLTPPMNKQLREKFLLRYKDIPDLTSGLSSKDGSKFDLYQDWLDCPSAINNPIYNSIYRLGLGRTS